jgi:hypothetical protein
VYNGEEIPATVVDTGDANVEVHRGDWAIIKSREVDLPALRVNSAFAFEFADPIFRRGNDYSRGIILSRATWSRTSMVSSRTSSAAIGVSGGGVPRPREGDLAQHSDQPARRRLSVFIPASVRAEMFGRCPDSRQG